MTQPKPHPQRVFSCGSCNNAEKTNAPFYPYKCHASKPVPMLVHEYCVGWFGYVGCASHTSAQPEQQRIDAVIEELKKLSKAKWDAAERTKNVSFSYEGIGVDEAIALLQAGDDHE